MLATNHKSGLSLSTIKALIQAGHPGMWAHQRGLCLVVARSGTASWAFRYSTKTGKRRLMTLEAYDGIDAAKLKALEWQAAEYRKQIRDGGDPLAERNAAVNTAIHSAGSFAGTFREVALEYIAQHRDGWKNPKHIQQWENTLATYVYPKIGNKRAHEITTDDVLTVLGQEHIRNSEIGPFWKVARETASRVRSRIELIIAAAKAKGISDQKTRAVWLNHHNPAQWRDNLEHWLNGKQSKGHFQAMDWKDAPKFFRALEAKPDISAKALLLTILCAVRTSETLNAEWSEIDFDRGVWTIPAERMKAGLEHRVPLSTATVELLSNLHRIQGNHFLFPGAKRGKPLSNMAMLAMLRGMKGCDGLTVHGFRSTFRDWVSETTLHPDTVAEMALAHTIKDKTERAYRRGDALERRRGLMQQWCDFLGDPECVYREKWAKFVAQIVPADEFS